MCVTTCTTTTANVGFFLTGTGTAAVPPVAAAPAASAVGTVAATGCTYDFLAIAGGFDPVTGVINDRYCGGALATTSVCSMFNLLFFSLNMAKLLNELFFYSQN